MAKAPKAKSVSFECRAVTQGHTSFYLFTAKASVLWRILTINTKIEDKDEGYQRVLSPSRVRAIAAYIDSGKPLPLSILVTFDKAEVSQGGTQLVVPDKAAAGWVIDGQHRLAGAHTAKSDVELAVVAFVGLDLEAQIEQFVTINKEAKGVPASLYYDLLKYLPAKAKPGDMAKERAADIAADLKRDEDSPFFGRIVVTTLPKKGEISLNNFVRKVAPLVIDAKGALSAFTVGEQRQILANYYRALQNVFPKDFNKTGSIFFQTLGFGALMNALPTFFHICIKNYKGFRVEDATKAFGEVQHFDFGGWEKIGTGSGAELQAGEDFREELSAAFETVKPGKGMLEL